MGSSRAIILLALCAVVVFQCVNSHKHHGHKREVEVKRATFNVTLDGTDSTETTADILTRLKLLAYAEKLKAKQAKKKAKADKKAQKEQAWNAYLMSLVPPAAGTGTGAGATTGAGTGAGAAGTAGTAPVLPPALGLWKKSFLLSQLAMAQAQAAAAAAAAEATTTPVPVSGVETTPADTDTDSVEEEE